MKTTKSLLKTLSILGAIVVTQFSQAQLSKGNWFVEGSLGNIYTTKSESETTNSGLLYTGENKNFSINVYPRMAYFVTDNFAVGVTTGLGFNSSNSENTNPNGIKTSDSESASSYFDMEPFVRYYFPGKEKIRFYGQAGAGMSFELSRKTEGSNYNGTTGALTSSYTYDYPKKYNTFIAEAMVGINYFFSDRVAFNSAIGYMYQNSKQTSKSTNTPAGGSPTVYEVDYTNKYTRINWNFGFTIFLHGSKSAAE